MQLLPELPLTEHSLQLDQATDEVIEVHTQAGISVACHHHLMQLVVQLEAWQAKAWVAVKRATAVGVGTSEQQQRSRSQPMQE